MESLTESSSSTVLQSFWWQRRGGGRRKTKAKPLQPDPSLLRLKHYQWRLTGSYVHGTNACHSFVCMCHVLTCNNS